MTKRMSLAEFQTLTGLSDKTLIQLLRAGHLPCLTDADGRVSVDLARFHMEDFTKSLREALMTVPEATSALMTEDLAALLEGEIGHIIDEALAILGTEDWAKHQG